MRARTHLSLVTLWGLFLLSGCGGGGGSGGTAAPLPRFTVSASAGENGSVSPASQLVTQGERATITPSPAPGYTVASAEGCGASIDNGVVRTAPVAADCAVTVQFRLPRVSGRVLPVGGAAVDSDVNDPLARFLDNGIDNPQPLGNPATLGGYVNVPDAGPAGRSRSSGDTLDVFRVSLFPEQLVTLQIASARPDSDDLDLFLLDPERRIIDASLSATSAIEVVRAPRFDGGAREFLVAVTAFRGASNYLLSLDEPLTPMASDHALHSDFITGEVLLDYREDSRSAALVEHFSGDTSAQSDAAVPRTRRLPLPASDDSRSQLLAAGGAAALPSHYADWLESLDTPPALRDKLDTLLAIKQLQSAPGVTQPRPHPVYTLTQLGGLPNDPLLPRQWHYRQINLEQAWPLSTGRDVVIAVIDSGVLLDHPDLRGRSIGGYDFLSGQPGGNDPGELPRPGSGSTYHGTHVAGTLAAIANNGTGIAGVAPDARLMPLRACENNRCPGFAIEQAVRYALGLPNDSGRLPPVPASIINLSLGRTGAAISAEAALYAQAVARGVVVVGSAGNNGNTQRFYPAAYPDVLAVGATDPLGRRAPYANFGSWLDLVAPGGDLRRDVTGDGAPDGVLSTFADDRDGSPRFNYAWLEGTSMATPHVAGVIALMRAVAPTLTPTAITNLLREGALTDDLGPPGFDDDTGVGQINAARAVLAAINAGNPGTPPPPRLLATPGSVNVGASLSTLEITLSNAGGGQLALQGISENSGGWLSLSAPNDPADAAAQRQRLLLQINREGLAEGSYEARIRVDSNANTVQIPVLMRVVDTPDADIGQQYVLLLDPQTLDTLYETPAARQDDGSYSFSIGDVEAGRYLLISGSDPDNDGLICDRAESCGVYRTLSDAQVLDVTGPDLRDLEFVSGYQADAALGSARTAAPGGRPVARLQRSDRQRDTAPRRP